MGRREKRSRERTLQEKCARWRKLIGHEPVVPSVVDRIAAIDYPRSREARAIQAYDEWVEAGCPPLAAVSNFAKKFSKMVSITQPMAPCDAPRLPSGIDFYRPFYRPRSRPSDQRRPQHR